jgi:hypothetical protein
MGIFVNGGYVIDTSEWYKYLTIRPNKIKYTIWNN